MNQIRLNSESVSVGAWRLGTKQADRLFGAGHDTQSACLAGVRQRRVGGVPTMSHASELAEQRQAREVDVVDAPDLEHAVGTDFDTVSLSFAPGVIDDGPKSSRRRSAVFPRPLRISGRTTCLLGFDLRFIHRRRF
jgi:hypothetical protein